MTVRNYGKCGFGNERIYRKTHEIINNYILKNQKNIYFYLSFLMLVEKSFIMLT